MPIQSEKVEKLIEAINTYQDLIKLKQDLESKIKEAKIKVQDSFEEQDKAVYELKLKEHESFMTKLNEEIVGWKQLSFEFVSAFPVGKVSEKLLIEDNLVSKTPSGNVRERVAVCDGETIAKFTYLEAGSAKRNTEYYGAN
jgi:hypothetical protein